MGHFLSEPLLFILALGQYTADIDESCNNNNNNNNKYQKEEEEEEEGP